MLMMNMTLMKKIKKKKKNVHTFLYNLSEFYNVCLYPYCLSILNNINGIFK